MIGTRLTVMSRSQIPNQRNRNRPVRRTEFHRMVMIGTCLSSENLEVVSRSQIPDRDTLEQVELQFTTLVFWIIAALGLPIATDTVSLTCRFCFNATVDQRCSRQSAPLNNHQTEHQAAQLYLGKNIFGSQVLVATLRASPGGMATLFDFLLSYILNIKVQSYFNVSALALYIWDYCITFEMEVDLVWNSNWSFTKCLFIVQRYLPFVDVAILMPYQSLGRNLAITDCKRVYQTLGWMAMTGTILSELLLALRVWALWNPSGRKWPAIILSISFIAFWGPTYLYVDRFLKSLQFGSLPFSSLPSLGCILLAGNNSLFLCYVTVMIWNTGTLIFMLIPGIQAYRSGGNSGLFNLIYRDGVTYYIYLVVLSCLNVVAIRTFPLGANYIFLSMERGLHTILASRVLLHIRNHVKNENIDIFEAS